MATVDRPIRVLHVMPWLSGGGPGRALLTTISGLRAIGQFQHATVSLRPADPWMVTECRRNGVTVAPDSAQASLPALIADADIVQLHFWNAPEMYKALGSELPEMRLLLWPHVSGEHVPQVFPQQLLRYADRVVASCAHTTDLPGLGQLDYIPAVAGWERVQHRERHRNRRFTVGYIGKLDFSKLHLDFVSMCSRVEIPNVRFLVCGDGGAAMMLRRQAAAAGVSDRIEFRGFVEDVGAALAEIDLLGYPLAPDSSVASELSLQEAMYAGVPPVVLGPAVLGRLVIHGKTGLVATNPTEYVESLGHLYQDRGARLALGEAAHEYALRHWSPEPVAARWKRAYEQMLESPKYARSPYHLGPSGAVRFIDSLAGHGSHFLASLSGPDTAVLEADAQIARSSGSLCTGDGGILHYRDGYPDDPHLRLWSGLIIYRQMRPALAAGEFAAAIRLGLDHWRVRWYLDVASQAAGVRVEPISERGVPEAVRSLATQVLQ